MPCPYQRIAFFCALMLAGVPWPAPGQTPPEHIEAYVLVVKAGQEESRGDIEAALALYQESQRRYQDVLRQYPDWQPEVVRYRIAHAQNQIERLQRVLARDGKAVGERSPAGTSPDAAGVMRLREEEWAAAEAQWREEKSVLELAIDELEAERVQLMETMAGLEERLGTMNAAQAGEREKIRDALERALRGEQEQAAAAEEWRRNAEARALEAEQASLLLAEAESRFQAIALEQERREVEQERVAREHQQAESFWSEERDRLLRAQQECQAALQEAESLKPLVAEHARLSEQFTALAREAGALSNRIQQLQQNEKEAQQEWERAQKDAAKERDRLIAGAEELKKTLERQEAQFIRASEVRAIIRRLEKENKELSRQVERLSQDPEKARQNEELGRLRNQNSVLMEELRVFRSHLAGSEQRNRELEQKISEGQREPAAP